MTQAASLASTTASAMALAEASSGQLVMTSRVWGIEGFYLSRRRRVRRRAMAKATPAVASNAMTWIRAAGGT